MLSCSSRVETVTESSMLLDVPEAELCPEGQSCFEAGGGQCYEVGNLREREQKQKRESGFGEGFGSPWARGPLCAERQNVIDVLLFWVWVNLRKRASASGRSVPRFPRAQINKFNSTGLLFCARSFGAHFLRCAQRRAKNKVFRRILRFYERIPLTSAGNVVSLEQSDVFLRHSDIIWGS